MTAAGRLQLVIVVVDVVFYQQRTIIGLPRRLNVVMPRPHRGGIK